MPLEPTLDALRERARMLQKARFFFSERNILEVDCCALSPRAAIDAYIDVIEADPALAQPGFLHTSPEYAMKRLLSKGLGDLYFLGHVFRRGDCGRLHNPEFTMAEWYRVGFSFEAMQEEAADFLRLFLGALPLRTLGYGEAFLRHTGIDMDSASLEELRAASRTYGARPTADWDRKTHIDFLLTEAVEPFLGRQELTLVSDFPPEEAALARVVTHKGKEVAQRFEIYYEGVELANGYCELGHGAELRRRFIEQNALRKSRGKTVYALDESFLSAMENHFPECCGVSVGFDRALMLRLKAGSIAAVLPFAWPNEL